MPIIMDKKHFIRRAIDLAYEGMESNQGGPFGCVIVKDGQIIAEANNRVTSHNDPTAHAEIVAIRNACEKVDSFQLTGCELYSSCEPCPMCLGAIYWARPDRVYYAGSRKDAASAGFDDDLIYRELDIDPEQRSIPMQQIQQHAILDLFEKWRLKEDKTEY